MTTATAPVGDGAVGAVEPQAATSGIIDAKTTSEDQRRDITVCAVNQLMCQHPCGWVGVAFRAHHVAIGVSSRRGLSRLASNP